MNNTLMNKGCFSHPQSRVTAICSNSHNEILFLRNQENENMNSMILPGDYVRSEELVEDALRRSIFDQTSLNVEPIEILGIYSIIDNQCGLNIIELVFVCIITNISDMGSKKDTAQFVWLDRDQIEIMESNICNIKIIRDYYSWRVQKATFWSTKI
jgi:8-oxo-dGTP diphosphatase